MKNVMTVLVLAGALAMTGCDNNKTKNNPAKAPPPPPMEPAPLTSTPTPAPVAVEPAPVSAAPVSNGSSASGHTYTVKPGDTLSKIAREQLGGINHLGALKAANPGIDVNKLKPGQKINLP
jgi:LysM repeat protein